MVGSKVKPNFWDFENDESGIYQRRKRIFTQEYFFRDFLSRIQATKRYNTLLMFGYDKAFLEDKDISHALVRRIKHQDDFTLRAICTKDEKPKVIQQLIKYDRGNQVNLKILAEDSNLGSGRFTIFGIATYYLEIPLDLIYVWNPDVFSQIPEDKKINANETFAFISEKKFGELLRDYQQLEQKVQN